MKRRWFVYMFALFCMSVRAEEMPKTLFYLPFDGTASAGVAGGDVKPLTDSGLTYGPGLIGQAVHFTQGAALAYAKANNLNQSTGTVAFWFKPDWSTADQPEMTVDRNRWRCFFTEPWRRETRLGSGALWFWLWGNHLRNDVSDSSDSYVTGSQPMHKGVWHHLAFTWDSSAHMIYFDGEVISSGIGDAETILKVFSTIGKKQQSDAVVSAEFDRFFVGNHNGKEAAEGWMDEFRIYDCALSPEQIRAECARILPVRLSIAVPNLFPSAGGVEWTLANLSDSESVKGACQIALVDPSGKTVSKNQQTLDLAPAETKTFHAALSNPLPGTYKLLLTGDCIPSQIGSLQGEFSILKSDNPLVGTVGGELKTTPVLSLHIPDLKGKENYVETGVTSKGSLEGKEYLEAGDGTNDRFAIHLTLPEAGVPYWVEWTYPDNKKRTMDVIAQSAREPGADYSYQTGVFCGEEYPCSNRMKTFRSLYWAKDTDVAFIFTTARAGAPAAVADLTISRIDGSLPAARLEVAKPVRKWTRNFGIYYEDPALNFDFGQKSGMMPDYEKTIDRLIAYMKWTGQNFLAYPGIWYHGTIGEYGYFPREHPSDYLSILLAKFEAQGLSFMPTINLHTIPLPAGVPISAEAYNSGILHSTSIMIQSSGKPNPGGFHGTPPLFNPLHPDAQKYIDDGIDNLLARYGGSSAFKGVILHLTKHTCPWFGSLEAGYNDYNIEAFEQDTGIKVPVSRTAPDRGKQYYEWLTANAKEQWVDWRCKKISQWYLRIAKRVAKRRADLKLGIFSYNPMYIEGSEERFGKPGAVLEANRECGLDPKYFIGAENVIISQTMYPSDYRWGQAGHGGHKQLEGDKYQYDCFFKSDSYGILDKTSDTWINMHDRYFENAVGALNAGESHWSCGEGKPLKAAWLKECGWRVSTLNPGQDYFLEQFLLPLKFHDLQGISKGGYLIGTLGAEEKLQEFAKAYLPLPAERFTDVATNNPDLTVRTLLNGEGTWAYIVNSGRKPLRVKMVFSDEPGALRELSSGTTTPTADRAVMLEVLPATLRSFKTDAKVQISVQ